MIARGATGKLYRAPKRNEHGDAVDGNGRVVRETSLGLYVGDVKGILIGADSASPALQRRGPSSDTSGTIGVPIKNTVMPQYGDLIEIDGNVLKIADEANWTYPNSMTGTRGKYAWFPVRGQEDG